MPVDGAWLPPQNPNVPERRFLALTLGGIALLAGIWWVNLEATSGTSWQDQRLEPLLASPHGGPTGDARIGGSSDGGFQPVATAMPPASQPESWLPRVRRLAETFDDEIAIARANLGSTALAARVRGAEALRRGDATRALVELERSRGEATVEDIALRAAALTRQNRLTEALHEYERLLALAPNDATARFNYAACLCRLDRTADAADHFRRVLTSDPGNDRAVHNLAAIYQRQGKLRDALELWERFCQRHPTLGSAWFQRGVVQSDLGRYEDALTCFRRSLELQPRDPVALVNVAVMLRHLGRSADAEPPLRDALAIAPNDPDVLRELIELHRYLSDVGPDRSRHRQEAVRLARRALAAGFTNPELVALARQDPGGAESAP